MARLKSAWDLLSMRDRALFIRLGLLHGLSNLKDIRDTYNLYSNGGDLGAYNTFVETLPDNMKHTDTAKYDMYRYWELNGRPKDFEEAKQRKMFRKESDGYYNASTLAEVTNSPDKHYGTLEFIKAKNHNTIGLEVGAYLKDKNHPMRNREYILDYTGDKARYRPRTYAESILPEGAYVGNIPITVLYANGGNLAHKFDGELVGLSLKLTSLAKPTAQLMTISGFESPSAVSKIDLNIIQDYISRFTLEHPNVNLNDLLTSLSLVPLYEGSLGNGVVAAWMSGKLNQQGNFTHGVAFDEYQNKDKEINAGASTLFVKAPKNALEHELLGHGVRDIVFGSTSGSTLREKEIIGNAYPFLYKKVYSHYKDNQALHLLAELLATNTQLRAMLQQNTGLYGEAFNKYVDSMSYEDLYDSLYTLNSGYYSNSDLDNFFDYNIEYTENELNQINELQEQLLKIRDKRDRLSYDIYEERQNENVRRILGDKYDSYFKDREKRKLNYDAQELEIQDLLYKLKLTLGLKNYKNVNQIEAIKNALKTIAYNTTNPFEVSNGAYLAALGGPLNHKKSGEELGESQDLNYPNLLPEVEVYPKWYDLEWAKRSAAGLSALGTIATYIPHPYAKAAGLIAQVPDVYYDTRSLVSDVKNTDNWIDEGLNTLILDPFFRKKRPLIERLGKGADYLGPFKKINIPLSALDAVNDGYYAITGNKLSKDVLSLVDNKKSTGGPLYPFSFEKNPYFKTPVVRYDEGGEITNINLPEFTVMPRDSFVTYTGEETIAPTLEEYIKSKQNEARVLAGHKMLNIEKPVMPIIPSLSLLSKAMGYLGMSDLERINRYGICLDPQTCIYTVTSMYPKENRVSGTETFADNSLNYGFIPVQNGVFGDIGLFDGHGTMITGFNNKRQPILSYSRGGLDASNILIDIDNWENSQGDHYLGGMGPMTSYRFIGTPSQQNKWIREYKSKYHKYE